MLELFLTSILNPRSAAERVFAWTLETRVLVLAALLFGALCGLFLALSLILVPPPEDARPSFVAEPFMQALVQTISIFVVAFASFRVGRMFGGTGDYNGALKLSVWVSYLGLFMSMGALIVLLLAPPIGLVVQLAAFFWGFAIFTIFLQVLHGFDSFFMTLAGTIGTIFAVSIVIVLVISSLGLLPVGGEI